MKIVFMGTPDFAVSTLRALIANHDVLGVFTQPDKFVGRHHVLTPPPVKVCAEENGITVYQPNTLRDGKALEILKELSPDAIVVVAYGKILPTEILEFPKYGCINIHASLLPKLRGAAPIQWSIVSGEEKTGITTMYMNDGIDTGDMLQTAETVIEEDDNFESLHDRLSLMGADLIIKTLKALEDGTAIRTVQDEASATYAPIIKKEMGCIDFTKTATEIRNLVRGFDPWPSAYTFWNGKRLKVMSAKVMENKVNLEPATVCSTDGGIYVACGEGTVLLLDKVQLEGSKAMQSSELLRGHKIEKGMKLGE
ncbi:MAG: methionyl-tRNA formyltransferase [Clostridia bacterium]|nr:methionyl-tRNA formyltransferase [Clostridia bacterium]